MNLLFWILDFFAFFYGWVQNFRAFLTALIRTASWIYIKLNILSFNIWISVVWPEIGFLQVSFCDRIPCNFLIGNFRYSIISLRSWEAGRFERMPLIGKSHPIVARGSRAPPHHTLPAFLNLYGINTMNYTVKYIFN